MPDLVYVVIFFILHDSVPPWIRFRKRCFWMDERSRGWCGGHGSTLVWFTLQWKRWNSAIKSVPVLSLHSERTPRTINFTQNLNTNSSRIYLYLSNICDPLFCLPWKFISRHKKCCSSTSSYLPSSDWSRFSFKIILLYIFVIIQPLCKIISRIYNMGICTSFIMIKSETDGNLITTSMLRERYLITHHINYRYILFYHWDH